MSDLAHLLARVRSATGPDRELAVDIWRAIDPDWAAVPRETCGYAIGPSSDITASLDAITALIERELPGWAKGMDSGPKTNIAFVDPHDYADRFLGARHTAEGPTAPLALTAALLSAKIALTDRSGE